ncbi:MAG: hypothetical protein MUQ76_04665, partial [Reinekea forsetii]|nr:hypothetical protein [Reinekea forsetii]
PTPPAPMIMTLDILFSPLWRAPMRTIWLYRDPQSLSAHGQNIKDLNKGPDRPLTGGDFSE